MERTGAFYSCYGKMARRPMTRMKQAGLESKRSQLLTFGRWEHGRCNRVSKPVDSSKQTLRFCDGMVAGSNRAGQRLDISPPLEARFIDTEADTILEFWSSWYPFRKFGGDEIIHRNTPAGSELSISRVSFPNRQISNLTTPDGEHCDSRSRALYNYQVR